MREGRSERGCRHIDYRRIAAGLARGKELVGKGLGSELARGHRIGFGAGIVVGIGAREGGIVAEEEDIVGVGEERSHLGRSRLVDVGEGRCSLGLEDKVSIVAVVEDRRNAVVVGHSRRNSLD